MSDGTKSHLPGEFEFEWSTGSNYGLDGFQFDTEYNTGVLEGAHLSEVRGLSDLPDGLIPIHAGGADFPVGITQSVDEGLGHLGHMIGEELPTLADLAWLEDPTQDPSRLPKDTQGGGTVIPELEEAWGVHRRTDGIQRVHATDLSAAQYQASHEQTGPVPAPSGVELAKILRQAVRKSAAGEPLADILKRAALSLGGSLEHLARPLEILQEEHGLAGNVFLRASAYPGCQSGKWKDHARKTGAKYLVQASKCSGCIHAQQCRCSVFQKELVASVPWDEALAYYRPRLESEGYRLASGSLPKEALRDALRAGIPDQTPEAVWYVTHRNPADRVSSGEARKEIRKKRTIDAGVSGPEIQSLKAQKSLRVQLARWKSSGLLTGKEASRVLSSTASPGDILKATASFIAARSARASPYGGLGMQSSQVKIASAQQAHQEMGRAGEAVSRQETQLVQASRIKVAGEIDKKARMGFLTKEQALELISSDWSADQIRHRMAMMISGLDNTPSYEGVGESVLSQPEASSAEARAQLSRVRAPVASEDPQVTRLLRWSRIQMNEGMAGKDLSDLIRIRFPVDLVRQASVALAALRGEQEGLAGHLYVEASAYASASGVKGCDEGASKHRTNGIRYLLAMEACAGCVFSNREGVCQKYNKPLVTEMPTEDPKAYQASMIRAANASDVELTSSLFAPVSDPVSEFHIGSATDLIDLGESPLTNEGLAEVFFGGIYLGE